MVEATQNSDTSNSSAVAKAVAALFFSSLAFAANGLQVSMFQSSYISDCIMFVAWKAWFPCCQGHVTVKPYSAQSLKKEKRSIGHCCFLYVLLLLNDFTCEIELLQFMLLVISQYTWAFAFLGVMIVILKFCITWYHFTCAQDIQSTILQLKLCYNNILKIQNKQNQR